MNIFIELTRIYKSKTTGEIKPHAINLSVDSIESIRGATRFEGHKSTIRTKSGDEITTVHSRQEILDLVFDVMNVLDE